MSVLDKIALEIMCISLASDGGLSEHLLSHSAKIVTTENGVRSDTTSIHITDNVNGDNGINWVKKDELSHPFGSTSCTNTGCKHSETRGKS
eukprot:1392600-Ditylum_brightwellii.AAC.1